MFCNSQFKECFETASANMNQIQQLSCAYNPKQKSIFEKVRIEPKPHAIL
jgi:hypothetical protein